MHRAISAATRLSRVVALASALAAGACASTGSLEMPPRPGPHLVPAADLASALGLTRTPIDSMGRISLVAPGGDSISLYAETDVATVRGRQFTTSRPLELRAGDAWLTADDAAAIQSLWALQVVKPLDLPKAPVAAAASPERSAPSVPVASAPSGPDEPTPGEVREWSVPLRRGWHYIVIHHSATDEGSAAIFDKWHRQRGWEGLGYDFVIGNGHGSADGAVEVGYRWRQQLVGAHAGNKRMNEEGIGICLVGDFTRTRPTSAQMRSLARLCNFLSAYCGISADNVLLHGDVRQTTCPGPLFPREFLSRRTVAGPASPVWEHTATR